MKTTATPITVKKVSPWKKHRVALLMLLPALAAIFVFNYLPLFGIVIAFKDFNILQGIWGSPWVGFQNFKQIFIQPEMLKAV